jgi:hypothetical protein
MRPTNTGINPSNTVALANQITYTKRAEWPFLHALRFALAEGENCCYRAQLRTVQSTKAAQLVTHSALPWCVGQVRQHTLKIIDLCTVFSYNGY